MKERAVLFSGGVETLDYFSARIREGLERRGVRTFLFDLTDARRQARLVKKFLHGADSFVLTFNFEGLEREEGLYSPRDSYVWQQCQVPVYNITVDHPYWYDNRVTDLLEDEAHHPGLLSLYHQFSIDRGHERYLQSFYPELQSAGFLPLAGTDPFPEEALLPAAEREETILFPGHYTPLSHFQPSIEKINEEYAAFYWSILEELIRQPEKTVEEVALAAVRRETGEEDKKTLRLVLYKMLFLDLYMRNYYRGKVVAALAEAGLPVTVIGKGWEELPLKKGEIRIREKMDSLGVLRAQREARVVLNVLPWFREGAHDRIWNGILAGAAVVTDGNGWLAKEVPEGCGVSYYSLLDMQGLVEKAGELLKDPERCREMVETGRPVVLERHTWDRRAEEILDLVNNGEI